ncbi:hypothetical protein ABZ436_23270 [Micromonospora matsumotoense]|uniref:hypothetical protein n=1 Tax=Micromonospora matsumotoense TaxID=121616 RepID=UPI0033E9F04A
MRLSSRARPTHTSDPESGPILSIPIEGELPPGISPTTEILFPAEPTTVTPCRPENQLYGGRRNEPAIRWQAALIDLHQINEMPEIIRSDTLR